MSVSEDLSKLSELYSSGVLSHDEFVRAKAQMLSAPSAVTSAPPTPPAPAYNAPATYSAPPAYAPPPQPWAPPVQQPWTPQPAAQPANDDRWLPPYHQMRFARFDAQGGTFTATWNWASFFFGIFWYMAKGLWAKAAIIFLLIAISGGILGLPILIYMSIAANYDYYLLKRRGKQLW